MARKDQHSPYRELLAARLDRPLTRVESRTLTTHLKGCAACQQVDAEYRAIRIQLRALSQPMPPRDMWARTSAGLDREVARGARTAFGRRVRRARRRAQPSSAMMSTIAAVGVITALAVFQLAPAMSPQQSSENGPTPFAVDPQQLAFLGLGSSDLAIYRMTVSQVCPQTATLSCVPAHKIVRTPIGLGLPQEIHANNAALSPTGDQLVLVGKQRDSDVIAVVMLPTEEGSVVNPSESVGLPESTETPEQPAATPEPPSPSPEPTSSPAPTASPGSSAEPGPSATAAQPTLGPPSIAPTDPPTAKPTEEPAPVATPTPARPPESAVPGLAVVNILEDVLSAGSPPAWSRDGSMLAFSAMPVDGAHGPDVYVWSPGDSLARPITTDHSSYFASWSGGHIAISRLRSTTDGAVVPRNYVVDPNTLEERRVRSSPIWLPTVNRQGTQAVVWRGELGMHDSLPDLHSGSLFLMAWNAVDPFLEGEVGPLTPGEPVQLGLAEDLRSAPVVDWQAGWSPDGRALGIWIADAVGSPWGTLTVVAIDPGTGLVADGEPLLPTTRARRGFSLREDRVAWVASSESNVDGELRVRTWTSDGFGGFVVPPGQEEVLNAF